MNADHLFGVSLLVVSLAFVWCQLSAQADHRDWWQIEADAYAMRVPTGDEWGR